MATTTTEVLVLLIGWAIAMGIRSFHCSYEGSSGWSLIYAWASAIALAVATFVTFYT